MVKAKDVMSKDVKICTPTTDLATVATAMWESGCGVLPVLGNDEEVVGMITDRDVCIAVAAKNRLATDIQVREVLCENLYYCAPDDDIQTVLEIMRSGKVYRLPVIDREAKLVGIISLDDIAHYVDELVAFEKNISYKDVAITLKAISRRHLANINK
ncbi:MAG: CBS domain-containing protein [Acidobacteriota bacterium]